jgi:hypothetical protein
MDINAWVDSLGVQRIIKAPVAMDVDFDGEASAPPPPPPRHSKEA